MGVFDILPFFCRGVLLFAIDCCLSVATAVAAETEDGHNRDFFSSIHPYPPSPGTQSISVPVDPTIIVAACLFVVFTIIVALVIIVKCCLRTEQSNNIRERQSSTRCNSGIDRNVVESLPTFQFSSLKGQKEGLECAVCLIDFEADDILRLLPKCKHGFHAECIDSWLDAHSTCPLCRYRIDPENVLQVDSGGESSGRASCPSTPHSSSSNRERGKEQANPKFLGRQSSSGGSGSCLEIIEGNPGRNSSGRFPIEGWSGSRSKPGNSESCMRAFSCSKSVEILKATAKKSGQEKEKEGTSSEYPGRRSGDSWRKEGLPPVQGDKHRPEHRIVICGGGEEGRRRRSDTEFMDLRSEMILELTSSSRRVTETRCLSEITGKSRHDDERGGSASHQEVAGLKLTIPSAEEAKC